MNENNDQVFNYRNVEEEEEKDEETGEDFSINKIESKWE